MTPLVLFVGFLGAGKTTFLRALLALLEAAGVEPHVLLNDFQNAEVDAAALADVAARLRPITGSCVCCGSRDELLDALYELPVNERSVVLLEAHGAVDADNLIELLTLDPRAGGFTLPWQLSVVDAAGWQRRDYFLWMEEAQIRTATHVFYSRAETVSSARLGEVQTAIAQLAPLAITVTPSSFSQAIIALRADAHRLPPRLHPADDLPRPFVPRHRRTRPHASFHFASMELALPPVVEEAALLAFLDALPREVVRAKGLVILAEHPRGHSIVHWLGHYRNHVFNRYTSRPQIDPLLILIGPNLPEAAVRRSLARHLAAKKR